LESSSTGKKKPRVLVKTASVVLVGADAVKACARRALHVKQAWSGSYATRTARSVITFKAEEALFVEQRNKK